MDDECTELKRWEPNVIDEISKHKDSSKMFNCHPCRNPRCTRIAGDTDYCDVCQEYVDKIKELETRNENLTMDLDSKNKLVEKLKGGIEKLEEENQNIKAMLADKNPNTCPLCEGEGTWEDDITLTSRECPCCHGKGSI